MLAQSTNPVELYKTSYPDYAWYVHISSFGCPGEIHLYVYMSITFISILNVYGQKICLYSLAYPL